MANKEEELRGGLNALFGGSTPQNQTEPEETPRIQTEETTEQDETDLINSVESEALREALRKKRNEKRGRPRKGRDANGKSVDGYDRTSLIVNVEKWAKIKEIAFRETLTMKEILELALDMVIDKYEKKHGVVIPNPENYKGNIKNIF